MIATSKIQQKMALFVENNQVLDRGKNLLREDRRLAAFFYALANRQVDYGAICDNYNMIATHPDARFLDSGMHVSTLLSLKEDSDGILSHINTIYNLLTEVGFWHDSPYIGAASYLISTTAAPSNFQNVVIRAKGFYDAMMANRQFSVDETDYLLVALFGLGNADVRGGLEKTENYFNLYSTMLKARRRSVQLLSMVSALSNTVDENRTVALRNILKKRKIWRFEQHVLPALGILAQIPADINIITQEIHNAQIFLQKQKGFSQMFVSKHELYLTVAMIVASAYLDEMKLNTMEIAPNIENMIISLQYSTILAVNIAARNSPWFGQDPRK